MIIRNTPENNELIIKERKEEIALRNNRLKEKLHEIVQKDEQTRINNYGEGWCYGCAKTDMVLTTLFYVCADCTRKRGRKGILAITKRIFRQELCDFCGYWKFNINQINCALCRTCQRRVENIHRKYRKGGGFLGQNPFIQMLKRKYGKDWRLQISPARKLPI